MVKTKKLKKHHICYYCGLRHASVEAGGVWACPNPLCRGPGGTWFRVQLKSYKDQDSGKHVVDEREWCLAGLREIRKTEDRALLAHVVKSAEKMITEFALLKG